MNDMDYHDPYGYSEWVLHKKSNKLIRLGKWTQRQKGLDEERLDEYDSMSVKEIMALFDLEHIVTTYNINWRIG